MLHDVGKIIIPTEIPSKPGRLSETEFRLIQAHARATFDILESIDFPWQKAEMALQHHERLDGSGHPRGLRGEQLLPEACVLAVADVVEAMSSHRPYRAALGIEAALGEITGGAGRLYDVAAVAVCVELRANGQFSFSSEADIPRRRSLRGLVSPSSGARRRSARPGRRDRRPSPKRRPSPVGECVCRVVRADGIGQPHSAAIKV
jgi:hypothetical protein